MLVEVTGEIPADGDARLPRRAATCAAVFSMY